MVTYGDLFQLGIFIVSIISLVIDIIVLVAKIITKKK